MSKPTFQKGQRVAVVTLNDNPATADSRVRNNVPGDVHRVHEVFGQTLVTVAFDDKRRGQGGYAEVPADNVRLL